MTRADLRWLVVAYAWVGLLLACAPSVTVGAGEIRSGQFHRQDALEVEASAPVGPLTAIGTASFRHGENDHNNRPWPPFLTAALGRHIGPIGAYAGLQSYPWSIDRWTWIAGPRLDMPLNPRVRLHLSHFWREEGLVGLRMGHWTPRTTFRLDWVLR